MDSRSPGQKSVSELLQAVVEDLNQIVRLEVKSLRAQIVAELLVHRQMSVLFVAAAGVACLALGALTLGLIDFLAEQTQWARWVCDLTVALSLGVISAAIFAGRKKWEQTLKLSKPN